MATTPPTRPYYPQIDKSIDPKAIRHFQNLYTAANDHDQAIIKVNTKILALQKTLAAAAGTSTTTNNNTSTIIVENGFPGQGKVNDQTGITAYMLQTGDNGVVLILSDASPVAVGLNSTVTAPYYFIAQNWGSGLVTFTPTSPAAINYIGNLGAASMTLAKGYETLVVWDGSDWWATILPVVPVDTPSVAHEFFTAYNGTTGAFSAAQPAFTDVTGAVGVVNSQSAIAQAVNWTGASYTVPANGMYRASAYIEANSGGAGATTSIRVHWTDDNGAQFSEFDDTWSTFPKWDWTNPVFFAKSGTTINPEVQITGTINYTIYYRLESLG